MKNCNLKVNFLVLSKHTPLSQAIKSAIIVCLNTQLNQSASTRSTNNVIIQTTRYRGIRHSKKGKDNLLHLVQRFLRLFLFHLIDPGLCTLGAIVKQKTVLLASVSFHHFKGAVHRFIGGFSQIDSVAFEFEIGSLTFSFRFVDKLALLI